MENQGRWVFDASHSEIVFKIRHLMISNIKGEFRKFDATLNAPEVDFNNASAKAVIDVSSIFTNNDDRDNHLRSADFFDVEKFKEIKFESTAFTKFNTENGQLKGKLTIKNITKEVIFEVEFGGISKDPFGNEKTGFSLEGKINRTDFGLIWNSALETGGVLVGEEVKITAEVQFMKHAV
jgi:polyisoprenoid-binding protein YceI